MNTDRILTSTPEPITTTPLTSILLPPPPGFSLSRPPSREQDLLMLMADSELLDDRLYHYQQHRQQQQPIYSNILGIFRRLRVEYRVQHTQSPTCVTHSEQFAINSTRPSHANYQ
jgi:hypothetical protein